MRENLHSLKHIRIWLFALAGGILFAALDRCGYMIDRYQTIWALSENVWHRTIFHRILCRLPLSVTLALCLLLAADLLRGAAKWGKKPGAWEAFTGSRFWFAGMWALYFVSFLPAFLGTYPGIFAADAPNQVGWTFSGWLTAHHPLLHTGILCAIFSMARSLGWSDNTAAAIYTVLQMAALSGIFAWISRFLKREKAPVWLQAGTVLYLCLFPFHGLMAVYTTKDTVFSGIFVLSLIQIYRMCEKPGKYFAGYRHLAVGSACFALMFLFRNNGFHTLLLCAPFLLFCLKGYWKKLLPLFTGLLLLYMVYNGPFLRFVGAEAGNSREAYSVIMQTLGRAYVMGGDIRPQEMDVIRPVMGEEVLAAYDARLSDPIKNYFHTEAFDENKGEFLKTWLTIGLRNKKIYIDAFLNTNLALWYPDNSGEYLEVTCFDIDEGNPNYPHVRMEPISGILNRYYTAVGTDAAFRGILAVRELFSPGFYFWLMVFAALYACYTREYRKLLWMLPCWSYVGTSLLGPAALLRYAYPVMLAAPVLLYEIVCRGNGK